MDYQTLIEYLQKVNGELCIFSGNAYYMLKSDGSQITDMSRGYLSGTNVTFKIKLFNFDKRCFGSKGEVSKRFHWISYKIACVVTSYQLGGCYGNLYKRLCKWSICNFL